MKLLETVLDKLMNTSNQKYAVVAKDSKVLDTIKDDVIANVDLGKVSTHIYLAHPIGIAHIIPELDGVYVELGCTSEEHLVKFLHIKDYNTVHYFNAEGDVL